MCGIIAFHGKHRTDLAAHLVERLGALEYRGYDSAGVAVWQKSKLNSIRVVGGTQKLKDKLAQVKSSSHISMAHTRWATHGGISEGNAHPIVSADGKAAIVLNGIIENDLVLRQDMSKSGKIFVTDNDAETLLHLVMTHYDGDLLAAVRGAVKEIHGRFAFCVMHVDHPQLFVAAKNQSPLAVGIGRDGVFVTSDPVAVQHDIDTVHHLEDGTLAAIYAQNVSFTRFTGEVIDPNFKKFQGKAPARLADEYETFTLQEIFEQPESMMRATAAAKDTSWLKNIDAHQVERVILLGCGSASFAAAVGKILFERYGRVSTEAFLASEFQLGDTILSPHTLVIGISQSGETADLLGCLPVVRKAGAKVIAICNNPSSTLVRESNEFRPIACGQEVAVASTKAFTGMLTHLVMMALQLGEKRGQLPASSMAELSLAAGYLPQAIKQILAQRENIAQIARSVRERKAFAFMGRESFYPIAQEGALKLKELTYRHAEGFAGGELKHGSLALVESGYPVIAIAPRVLSSGKMIGNIQEVKARGAKVIGVITEGDKELENLCSAAIKIPACPPPFLSILAAIPLQLFAYELARSLGRPIDKPRNLAKSLTVE